MNALVYSVNSCSDVSSRDCLIASNKLLCLLFGSWFRNPQKEQKLRENISEKKTPFHVRAGPVKWIETRQG